MNSLSTLAAWIFMAWSMLLVLPEVHAAGAEVYLLHTDSSCSSTPTMAGFQTASSCSTSSKCSSIGVEGEELYWSQACATTSYATSAASAFGAKPYLLMEIYESGDCTTLLSGVVFLADGSCLVTDNGVSSVQALLNADNSASFVTFRGVNCSGTAVKNSTISSSALTSHSCVDAALKFYSSDSTTTTTDGASTTSTGSTTTSSNTSVVTATSRATTHSSGLLTAVISMVFAAAISIL